MKPMTFEEQLNCDVQDLRRRFVAPAEIRVTRCGEPSDDWVSWDIDMVVSPEKMNADALKLYGRLGDLLNHDPYRVMDEGITLDTIGFVIIAAGAVS